MWTFGGRRVSVVGGGCTTKIGNILLQQPQEDVVFSDRRYAECKNHQNFTWKIRSIDSFDDDYNMKWRRKHASLLHTRSHCRPLYRRRKRL